mmetsp:Transcript_3279/g.11502  ORF Transcript_3279/g.11502 Transcript_3279/m.11502 type:complete len:436 (-) Transcript_3279:3311-4618(-)
MGGHGGRQLGQRGLHAQRQAGGALQTQQGLGHQQPEAVGLARQGGQQHAGRGAGGQGRQRMDGLAQHQLQGLAVDVLLEHLQRAVHPQLADKCRQWRKHLGDAARQASAQHRLRQLAAQAFDVVGLQQRGAAGDLGGLVGQRHAGADARHRLQQCLQLLQRGCDDPAGPVAGVQQALDQAQPLHLIGRVEALARGVALRRRKPVTPLPHTQGFLVDAELTLDGGDADTVVGRERICTVAIGVNPGVRHGEQPPSEDGPGQARKKLSWTKLRQNRNVVLIYVPSPVLNRTKHRQIVRPEARSALLQGGTRVSGPSRTSNHDDNNRRQNMGQPRRTSCVGAALRLHSQWKPQAHESDGFVVSPRIQAAQPLDHPSSNPRAVFLLLPPSLVGSGAFCGRFYASGPRRRRGPFLVRLGGGPCGAAVGPAARARASAGAR